MSDNETFWSLELKQTADYLIRDLIGLFVFDNQFIVWALFVSFSGPWLDSLLFTVLYLCKLFSFVVWTVGQTHQNNNEMSGNL